MWLFTGFYLFIYFFWCDCLFVCLFVCLFFLVLFCFVLFCFGGGEGEGADLMRTNV